MDKTKQLLSGTILAGVLCSFFVTPLRAGDAPTYFNDFDVENGLIDPQEIDHGGPGRDGVPALDHPRFHTGAARDDQIAPGDRVLGVHYNGVSKAYPIDILDFHEIVNDQFGDTPLTVTFCPLCGTGMVFYARVGDQVLNFGVSGLIYNSDLLLYDRNTLSLWSQLMKTAVTGPLAGSRLVQVPAQYTTWSAWVKQYPGSLLLSRDTGHLRDYDDPPYQDYRRLPVVMYPTSHQDWRIPAKTWVVGVTVGEDALALPFQALDQLQGPLDITVGGTALQVRWDREASVARVFDREGSEVPSTAAYWFAWVAFHPGTGLYTPDAD
jgi:hypothetical protein